MVRLIAIAVISVLLAMPAISGAADGSALRVGHVYPRSEPWGKQFYEGLRDEGFVDGVNLSVISFETGTNFATASAFVDQLITEGADVIVAQPGQIARQAQRAVQKARKSIPIVFLSYDPIEEGFVSSLGRPDRNMTGVASMVTTQIYAKQVELLLEVVPRVYRIGYLRDPTGSPTAFARVKHDLEEAASAKNIHLAIAEVPSPDKIETVLMKLQRDGVGAVIVPPTAFFITYRRLIIDTVARLDMPAFYGDELFVREGGLIGYWPSMATTQRIIGRMTGMLLKGKRAADIPVEQPAVFRLTVNQKTAASLKLTVPSAVLMRADEVVK